MDNEFVDRSQLEEKEAAETKKKRQVAERARKIREKRPNAFVQILNGEFFTREFVVKNLAFFFFVMFLLLLTVSKGYYGKRLSKDVTQRQEELDELTSDYFEAKARLEQETGRTTLVEQLESRGLKETVNPTKVIRVRKGDEE